MVDEDTRKLAHCILDYLVGLPSVVTRKETRQRERKTHILIEFLFFAIHKGIGWKNMFTLETFTVFRKLTGNKGAGPIIGLSQYLHEKGRIE